MDINDLNTGSGGKFYKQMLSFSLIKFGENPCKHPKFPESWKPTSDEYANNLLEFFIGITTERYGSKALRIFLRVILANELGQYLLTGNKTNNLYYKVKELDKMYHLSGIGSLHTKALPEHY